MKISIVFPALNESAVIEKTLDSAIRELKSLGLSYEIIVVDNASTDNTVALVEAMSVTAKCVRVVRHPQNLGYANSNLTGFRESTGDVVVVADSDGQHTLQDLPLFLAKIDEGADIVYGWRRERHDPFVRKVVSAGLGGAAYLFLRWRLHDINCGFRAVKAPVARSMTKAYPVNYFGPELWVHALNRGFTVTEVVVRHAKRDGGGGLHAAWRLPRAIFRAFRYLFWLRKDLPANADEVSQRILLSKA